MDGTMPKGRHPENALTALGVAKLSAPGRYADGNGLYLVVEDSGAKRWVLRTSVRGRRRDMGLGGIRTVSLAQARGGAQRYRAIARSGGDPFEERRRGMDKFRQLSSGVSICDACIGRHRGGPSEALRSGFAGAVSFDEARRGELVHVPYDFPGQKVDHVLGNIAGVISDTLKLTAHR